MAYTDLSGSKLQSKLGAMLNESASAPTSKFAQRHMAKMGWTEGTGLGKNRSGIVSHIKVRKREDEMGLGVEKAAIFEAGNTWQDSVGATLARLSKGKKDAKSKRKEKKERSKHSSQNTKEVTTGGGAAKIYTDEELFMATGGARFGMRAQRRAEAKWARTESGSELWEEEVKARKRVEWNGLGAAKVLVGDADALQEKTNGSNYTVVVEEQTLTETKRKMRKKNVAGENGATSVWLSGASSETNELSPPSSRTSSDSDEGRKKRKRRKKEKRVKKQQLKAAVEETDNKSSRRSFNAERKRKKKRARNDKEE